MPLHGGLSRVPIAETATLSHATMSSKRPTKTQTQVLLLAPVPFDNDLLDIATWRRRARRVKPIPVEPLSIPEGDTSPHARILALQPASTSASTDKQALRKLRALLRRTRSSPMAQRARFRVWTAKYAKDVLITAMVTALMTRKPHTKSSSKRGSACKPPSEPTSQESG